MGADVMRWQYCVQPPSQNLLFGFGPGQEIQRKLLTLWNTASFFIQYANIAGFTPTYADLADGRRPSWRALDRWLVARTRQLVADATDAYERYLTVDVLRAFEAYVDDLSNWYVRRSRRRFWDGDEAALRTLWSSLVNALRVVAPVMPFLTEHLWQILVRDVAPRRADVGLPRRVARRSARSTTRCSPTWPPCARSSSSAAEPAPSRSCATASRCAGWSSRAPTAAQRHADEIAEELRVKEVEFGPIEATELRVRPEPEGARSRASAPSSCRCARRSTPVSSRRLDDGGFRVAGHDLGADDVLVEAHGEGGLGRRRPTSA